MLGNGAIYRVHTGKNSSYLSVLKRIEVEYTYLCCGLCPCVFLRRFGLVWPFCLNLH